MSLLVLSSIPGIWCNHTGKPLQKNWTRSHMMLWPQHQEYSLNKVAKILPIVPLSTNIWSNPENYVEAGILHNLDELDEVQVALEIVLPERERKRGCSLDDQSLDVMDMAMQQSRDFGEPLHGLVHERSKRCRCRWHRLHPPLPSVSDLATSETPSKHKWVKIIGDTDFANVIGGRR